MPMGSSPGCCSSFDSLLAWGKAAQMAQVFAMLHLGHELAPIGDASATVRRLPSCAIALAPAMFFFSSDAPTKNLNQESSVTETDICLLWRLQVLEAAKEGTCSGPISCSEHVLHVCRHHLLFWHAWTHICIQLAFCFFKIPVIFGQGLSYSLMLAEHICHSPVLR